MANKKSFVLQKIVPKPPTNVLPYNYMQVLKSAISQAKQVLSMAVVA